MSLSHRPATRAVRRLLATTTAGAMVIALGPLVGPAAAQTPRGIDDVCPPPGQQTQDKFTDDEASVHEPSINCAAAAAYNIALGKTAQLYAPRENTKRDQMASFIARLITTAGGNLPANPADKFTDDDESVHEDSINQLAAANVVSGKTATQYNPNQFVLRDQMATFIARAIDFRDDGQVNGSLPPSTTQDFFTDDGQSVHENNINRLAAVGIVAGRGNQQYDPNDPVDRAAMATFLMQAADFLDERGLWAPTVTRLTVTGVPNQVTPGQQVTATVQADQPITTVTVSGCGISSQQFTTDADAGTAGFQVQFTIPSTQQAGACDLQFQATLQDGTTRTRTVSVTVATDGAVPGATERPEVTAAQIVSTTAIQGTIVEYTFDEAVTGGSPVPSRFHVYQFDRTPFAANSAEIVSGTPTKVRATFPTITTQLQAGRLTLAAVEFQAVTDLAGLANPIGDAPLTPAGGALQAGITVAPDLQSVGNFRASGTATTLVDFVFDENTWPTGLTVDDPPPFDLVPTTAGATDIDCDFADGEGTNTITVACPNAPLGGGTIQATQIARGYVAAEAVSDAATGGNTNVLQAADVSAGGNTNAPDLVSAEIRIDDDEVVYTFDEIVFAPGGGTTFTALQAAGFNAYQNDSDQIDALSARRGTNATQVIATFPSGALDTAVGASVDQGAVVDTEGLINQEDEVAVTPAGVVTGGRTSAPDLTAAAVTQTSTGFRVTYTFDEEVEPPAGGTLTPARFHAYQADGLPRFEATACSIPTTADNTVRCEFDAAATGLVLATVEAGAVEEQGTGTLTNPLGAERIG